MQSMKKYHELLIAFILRFYPLVPRLVLSCKDVLSGRLPVAASNSLSRQCLVAADESSRLRDGLPVARGRAGEASSNQP